VPGSDTTAGLVEQVIDVAAAIAEDLQAIVRELDLTDALANFVWALDPAAEPVPLRQLAGRLRCAPSNVTLLSAQLEEKGLAERRPHPADGRVRTLVLTPAGTEVRRKLMEHVQRRSPFAALTEQQQRQLRELLAVVLEGRESS
jgi:DNA-binding MarR family transcriptional regulator